MLKSNPLVTILLPVYNGENTIKATLESLLAQTYPHFEILVGIDGTYDGSQAIAESFKDARIKIIQHPQNLGLANNLNALIQASAPQSEFLAMAEQDDVYVPERLQWQVTVMQQHPEVGLVSGIAVFKGDSKDVRFPGILCNGNPFPQGEVLFKYLYENQLKVVNTCMMIRKTVHKENQLQFNNTYGNFNVDWDYVLRFALVSQVYGIPKVLVHMNRSTKRQSVTTNKWGQFKASRQLLKDFKKEFPEMVSRKLYSKALKVHRKIELGNRNKFSMVCYGLCYFLLYFDFYYVRYVMNRFKKIKWERN
ncbi:glycosyltransferase family 2 protein [Seonamhaeicola aphaedonensis]|uniref:GT2 family glycosyltransferase n=1 Tax=Seonamhaeicola aphaedonensis TaxID=1461338 RepID=A0A3D9HFY1_9FLAO|nr:glycosyltransferase family 2 protein [Seonamhaeicola aphaedonensis]RED48370.1 GT2 family glycosyltransferase [Seonamhaeicola aphaedonensis]